MTPGLFLLSVAICAAFVLLLSLRLAAARPDRAFIAVIALGLHISGASFLSSLFGRYEPVGFLVMQGVLLLAALTAVHRAPRHTLAAAEGREWDAVVLALRVVILVVIALSAARQFVTPLGGFDERMYQASRVGYWIQNKSILWFETHNPRQVAFPTGAEVFFGWGVLFTRSELLGKMLFWLGYPLTVLQVGMVCLAAGLSRRVAASAALLFAITPTALDLAVSLKSDLWSPVFLLASTGLLLGASFRPPRPELVGSSSARLLLAGIGTALAVNIKTTALAAVPGLGLLALGTIRPRPALARGAWCGVGMLLAIALSGLGALMVQNTQHYRHPLGPRPVLQTVRAELSAETVKVHAARVPFVLAELPEVPSDGVRKHLEQKLRGWATAMGAHSVLPRETDKGWPGIYTYTLRATATRYGLGGLLWLPVLAGGVILLCFDVIRRRGLSPASKLLLVVGPLFVAIVFLIRWMGGGPERFWSGPYAVSVAMAAVVLAWPARRWIGVAAACIVMLGWAAAASMRYEIQRLDSMVRFPPAQGQMQEPYAAAMAHLPRGSRILLVASVNTRDYPLFRPEEGFGNRVIPWGERAYAPEALEAMLEEHRPTHVLLERGDVIGYFSGAMRTAPMVSYLRAHPRYREVPLGDPAVLFERVEAEEDQR